MGSKLASRTKAPSLFMKHFGKLGQVFGHNARYVCGTTGHDNRTLATWLLHRPSNGIATFIDKAKPRPVAIFKDLFFGCMPRLRTGDGQVTAPNNRRKSDRKSQSHTLNPVPGRCTFDSQNSTASPKVYTQLS